MRDRDWGRGGEGRDRWGRDDERGYAGDRDRDRDREGGGDDRDEGWRTEGGRDRFATDWRHEGFDRDDQRREGSDRGRDRERDRGYGRGGTLMGRESFGREGREPSGYARAQGGPRGGYGYARSESFGGRGRDEREDAYRRDTYARERDYGGGGYSAGWSSYSGMGEDGPDGERMQSQGGMYGTQREGYGSRTAGSWGRDHMSSGHGFGHEEHQRRRGHSGRGPKGYQRSDERIREEICERLTHDDHIDASEIEIRVENGEVTLTGTVENRHCKREAEDLAEQVLGVKEVHNQIRVVRRDHDQQRSAGNGQTQTQMQGSHQAQQRDEQQTSGRTPNGRRDKTS